VTQVVESAAPMRLVRPKSPAANAEGYVTMPNVNVVEEMTNMISASRAYQTNADVMGTAKTLMERPGHRPVIAPESQIMSTVNSPPAPTSSITSRRPRRRVRPRWRWAQTSFSAAHRKLKNQDPLSPMDNAQMTSQLAQISTVDGLGKLNKTLTSTLLEAASRARPCRPPRWWARWSSGNGLALERQGPTAFELTTPGRQGQRDHQGFQWLEAQDRAGRLRRRCVQLCGTASPTAPRPSMAAILSVKATRGDTSLSPTALQLGSVNSVLRTSAGSVSIDVGGGKLVTLSDIKQIL
jgi:hypothetical protein